jgi:hypothetical protein
MRLPSWLRTYQAKRSERSSKKKNVNSAQEVRPTASSHPRTDVHDNSDLRPSARSSTKNTSKSPRDHSRRANSSHSRPPTSRSSSGFGKDGSLRDHDTGRRRRTSNDRKVPGDKEPLDRRGAIQMDIEASKQESRRKAKLVDQAPPGVNRYTSMKADVQDPSVRRRQVNKDHETKSVTGSKNYRVEFKGSEYKKGIEAPTSYANGQFNMFFHEGNHHAIPAE